MLFDNHPIADWDSRTDFARKGSITTTLQGQTACQQWPLMKSKSEGETMIHILFPLGKHGSCLIACW